MKKAIAILILATLLSGCAQSAEPSAEVVTTISSSAIISTEREKPSGSVTTAESKTTTSRQTTTQIYVATTTTTSATTTHTAPMSATERTSRETTQPSESKAVSARQEPVRATTTMTTTTAPTTEQQRSATTTIQTTQSAATTTTRTTTTAKPKATTKQTTTTTQPAVTTTTKITVPKPPIISKATTTVTENGITYVEVPDITCLATMIEDLEETDTPPIYYINVGKKLRHDGTDYGKAVSVFRWMEQNGWGSCVYHSLEAFYVCQGIGLECAYAFCTDNGWYGHTITVVKVEGEWYALDTQAGIFLDNWPYVCKRMFDGMDRDLPGFDEDAFYPYDEDGKYRNWSIEYID